MNDFTLESQDCDMKFRMNIEKNLISIEAVNWTINAYGRRVDDLSGYIDLSIHEVKFLRDSLNAFLNKIEDKK